MVVIIAHKKKRLISIFGRLSELLVSSRCHKWRTIQQIFALERLIRAAKAINHAFVRPCLSTTSTIDHVLSAHMHSYNSGNLVKVVNGLRGIVTLSTVLHVKSARGYVL